MKNLHYQVIRGDPIIASSLLRGAVSSIRQNYREKQFKIGITNNPESRSRHETYDDYHDMFVLYETNIREHIEEMERILIDSYWEDVALANERNGGAGRKSEPPYFLYVAMKRRNRIRMYLSTTINNLFRQLGRP